MTNTIKNKGMKHEDNKYATIRVIDLLKLFDVNGKPIRFVIGQYVDRKDVNGLAEFFRAFLEDLQEMLPQPKEAPQKK